MSHDLALIVISHHQGHKGQVKRKLSQSFIDEKLKLVR
ncbi:hypothetical protein cce_3179 [Crocosphaera subtropica ATCC 51142]|uniref:Uncharacterized protein n=1 Tax=Crocosphaera subtropica (strain ATCC 51142 / BH68) TaxID=43989 RepID=B1WXI6_CROS5|nr:hypothetical protein cce_3179 [Crocosphaera subtropica ATCC 51142]